MCENLGGPERLPHTDLKPRSSSWMDGAGALEQRSRVPRQWSCGGKGAFCSAAEENITAINLIFPPKLF